jgi:hypothetical protein
MTALATQGKTTSCLICVWPAGTTVAGCSSPFEGLGVQQEAPQKDMPKTRTPAMTIMSQRGNVQEQSVNTGMLARSATKPTRPLSAMHPGEGQTQALVGTEERGRDPLSPSKNVATKQINNNSHNSSQDSRDINSVEYKLPTPITFSALQQEIAEYPILADKDLLLSGFKDGFNICYEGPRRPVDCNNLRSFTAAEDIGLAKVNKEVQAGRYSGPYKDRPFPNLQCSPLGLVPKKGGTDYRLIHHLSFGPDNKGVNQYIPRDKVSVQYETFDHAIDIISQLGKGAVMSKFDIRHAFRLLCVRKQDRELLGFKIGDQFWFDSCLPFGLAISCNLFQKFSSFLKWRLIQITNIPTVTCYLDDYLLMSKPGTNDNEVLCHEFAALCDRLGIELASEKAVFNCTKVEYLGLEIDSVQQCVTAPKDKIDRATQAITQVMACQKITLKQLQHVAGVLAFLCRPIASGRAFLYRLYEAMQGQRNLIPITADMKDDLHTWLYFLKNFTGTTYFHDRVWYSSDVLELYTDASGFAYGMYFQGAWAQGRFPVQWLPRSITFKEFFPIMAAVTIWKDKLANRRLKFFTDNMGVMSIINKKTSKCPLIMKMVRVFVLSCLQCNITTKAVHIPSKQNTMADALSRFEHGRFRQACPHAELRATRVPDHLFMI